MYSPVSILLFLLSITGLVSASNIWGHYEFDDNLKCGSNIEMETIDPKDVILQHDCHSMMAAFLEPATAGNFKLQAWSDDSGTGYKWFAEFGTCHLAMRREDEQSDDVTIGSMDLSGIVEDALDRFGDPNATPSTFFPTVVGTLQNCPVTEPDIANLEWILRSTRGDS